MKYNEKYNRWFTKEGLVYRYDSRQDKLVLCNNKPKNGYINFRSNGKFIAVHRAVYETFVGEIPQGYEIDHINTIRDDNRVDNLRAVTPKENSNNKLTLIHKSEKCSGIVKSEFGEKFREHYGKTWKDDITLYRKEHNWYLKHNRTCKWEKTINTKEVK